MTKHIVTVTDPAVRTLLPKYLGRRQQDLRDLRSALDSSDFETIGRIAHGLTGSGGLYGLQPVSDFGALLGEAARDRDRDAAGAALTSLRAYLDRLEIR